MEQQIERRESNIQLGILLQSVDGLKEDIKDLKGEFSKLEKKFVTKVEFAPVKNIVYGMVGLFLVGIITAVLKLIISGAIK